MKQTVGKKKNKGSFGQFGFYNICNEDDLAVHIVQLGWSVGGPAVERPYVKERLVRPDGFTISAEAVDFHGITQEHAEENGAPSIDVLSEFVADVFAEHARGSYRVSSSRI